MYKKWQCPLLYSWCCFLFFSLSLMNKFIWDRITERETQKKLCSISWLIPQMTTRAEPGESQARCQELHKSSWQVAGVQALGLERWAGLEGEPSDPNQRPLHSDASVLVPLWHSANPSLLFLNQPCQGFVQFITPQRTTFGSLYYSIGLFPS